MAKMRRIWSCSDCGHVQIKWTGCCAICQKWNTFVEEVAEKEKRFEAVSDQVARPMRIVDVEELSLPRLSTRIVEFDRLLGGGIVPGSLTLIGGDPGIGKSTLMLQIARQLADQGLLVLYICGEESVEQTSLRARRLGVQSESLYLLAETLFSHIKLQIDQLKPDVLIVDSIQILYKAEIPSSPGSVTQVRELATEFMHLSKGLGISTFLIGHVTKSGEIAGPRVLEHIVDAVLDFEGDRQHGYRMLRAVKNRFGPTDEIALFQMNQDGLSEVRDPSHIFLAERLIGMPGSAIVPTLEGSRSLLIEVQALVAQSAFPTSSRRSAGLDPNRLTLLLAVLEKRMRYQIQHCDVFVSVAGGLKINEPALDLGILMAIASSFSNRALGEKTAIIGEVGLGGEVRSVPRIEARIKEVIHMGFEECILPKRNVRGLEGLGEKIRLVGVDAVDEVIF